LVLQYLAFSASLNDDLISLDRNQPETGQTQLGLVKFIEDCDIGELSGRLHTLLAASESISAIPSSLKQAS
jgi:hypothetical protein